jgi:amidase
VKISTISTTITRRAFGQSLVATAVASALSPLANAAALAPSELCFMSAVDLASLLRKKSVSAREVMSAHLAQIERFNPKVNAIVTVAAEHAMKEAARADEKAARGEELGVLHGLPIAHKDLVDTAGIRTTRGSRFYRDNVPTKDAEIVRRTSEAGAITCGKSNTPEFGAGSQTFNSVFGATRNPYDLGKTCGGSSGGAAVALACLRSLAGATRADRFAIPPHIATSSACVPRLPWWVRGRLFRSAARWRVALRTSHCS